MSITLSGDIGTIITAIGTVAIGVVQVWQGQRSKQWREDAGRKIDENTALTKTTAVKVEEVHAQVASASGTFPTIKDPSG